MPALSPSSLAAAGLCLVIGIAIGWLVRNSRSAAEKAAINLGWQAQMDATRNEHRRLSDQNKSLMEQVNHLQSASRSGEARTRELSSALKEALGKRDELHRDIKAVRNNLENAVSEKHRLKSDLSQKEATAASATEALKERDERIEHLKKELKSWQDRLPPLIERFRERNEEANRLQVALDEARARIAGLETVFDSDETHVGPLAADELLDSVEASNESIDEAPDDDEDEDAAEQAEHSDEVVAPIVIEATNGRDFEQESGSKAAEEIVFNGGLRDDLKAIKGVGPAIEKTLNELGIFRYAQVAEMTNYDIERIANRLKGFKGRIEREDWMGQARMLDEQRPAAESIESRQGEY